MTEETLKIRFGQPEHGWLPVDVTYGDFDLQFHASYVPVNPINQLILGIRQITHGIKTEVWWHLEPEGYYFDFDRVDNLYKLTISFTKRNSVDREVVFETEGGYDMIVMPFYRSLKNFFSKAIEESNWPKTDETEIKKLTIVVKGRL